MKYTRKNRKNRKTRNKKIEQIKQGNPVQDYSVLEKKFPKILFLKKKNLKIL